MRYEPPFEDRDPVGDGSAALATAGAVIGMGHVPSPPLSGGRATHDADRESLLTRSAGVELRGAPIAGNRVDLLALGLQGVLQARASNWTLDADALGPVGEDRIVALI